MDDFNLFDLICCPKCSSDFKKTENELICLGCSQKYKIKDGIPILVDPNFRL